MTQIYTPPFISPMLERSSSYDQGTVNDNIFIRGTQKTDQYPAHHRPHERSFWEPRPPMPEYKKEPFEAAPPKAGELYPKRPEISQNLPREQLPPLSSLFASSSSAHQSRPAQSPYLDRRSPVFPTASPTHALPPAARIHPERAFDTSHFQRPAAALQYPYTSRAEPVDRLGFPAAARAAEPAARPESPRYEPHYGSMEISRPPHPSGWSPHAQASTPDYFARDTSSSFRPHSGHRPQPRQIHGPEPESRPTYRDPAHSTGMPIYPPTPASTVAGEPTTTKDGLGPKVWTGSQFLPRFVRQAEVPGEGMCYFYDDGTHCKTVIDGEVVNAHWGVTKAGKPRKRLAIACITCREKKIKCDPDYPRCVQCEKFGRICKFKNAPRGGQGSPGTPPADSEDLIPRPLSSRTDVESFQVEQCEDNLSVSPRLPLRRATPDSPSSEIHRPKHQRTGYTDFTPVTSEASPRASVQELTSPSNPWLATSCNIPIDHSVLRDWQVNPYTTQPAIVTELMGEFFRRAPETANSTLPEGPFTAWALSSTEKSLDDLMLIYTILALGTVFSSKPEHKALGVQYATISRYACNNRPFSLQLVQARMIIALYYFAINNPNDSWDACGGSIRAANALRLNVEFEKSEDVYLTTFPYGLNRHGYAECRRRTFWCCYLMDRFNGFCSGHFSVIHPQDVFLRLPCDPKSFETQVEVRNPYFDPSTPIFQNTNWTVGSMAYLINICTIWGEIMGNVYRTTQRVVPTASTPTFPTFHETMTQRLHAWRDALPPCYQFSAESLQGAADRGKLGGFMMMHAVYHTTAIKLNRYMQHSTLSTPQIAHHVAVAQEHAETLLSFMDTLAARHKSSPNPNAEQRTPPINFSSPFVGCSIISAVDVLTAKVSLTTLPKRLSSFSGALTTLAELATYWQSAKAQQALILQRIRDLAELNTREEEQGRAGGAGFHNEKGRGANREGLIAMNSAIEKTFPRDYDCAYAL